MLKAPEEPEKRAVSSSLQELVAAAKWPRQEVNASGRASSEEPGRVSEFWDPRDVIEKPCPCRFNRLGSG